MKTKSLANSVPALLGIFFLLLSPPASAQAPSTAADIDSIINDIILNGGTYAGSFTGTAGVIESIYATGTTNAAAIVSSSGALQTAIDAKLATTVWTTGSADLVTGYTALVGSASTALQDGIDANAGNILALTGSLNGLITYDSGGNGTIFLGTNATADTVNIGRTPGTTRKLTGLTAGSVAANSTDAINGDQFFTLSSTVGTFSGTIDAIGDTLYHSVTGLAAVYATGTTNSAGIATINNRLNDGAKGLDAIYATGTTNKADISNLSGTIAAIDSTLNHSVTGLAAVYATGTANAAAITSASNTLQNAITDNTTLIGTSSLALFNTITTATAALGVRIDGVNELIVSSSGALSGRIDNEVLALNNTINTATAALQTNIDTLGTALTTATAALDTRITTEVGALNTAIATASTALNTRIDTLQVDLDALDATAVKYANGSDPTINLRAGSAITNLADVTSGDSDQTKAVNIASAKTIATEIATSISGSAVAEANKSVAFSAGNTAASIGAGATAAMAVGSGAIANAGNAIALGAGAFVSDQAAGSVALGAGATASHANSVALGAGTATTEADSIAAGNRVINQVAAKDLAAASTNYAATTGQLYNTGVSLAATLGGGATLGAGGAISGWGVTLASGTGGAASYTNVADALTGLDQNLTDRIDGLARQHSGDITALDGKIDQEIADRAALIRSETRLDAASNPALDANGDEITDIHIGGHSLATAEVAVAAAGGAIVTRQQLFARDAAGDAIAIDIANGSKLLVDGDEVIGKNAVQARIDTTVNAAKAELNTRIDGIEQRVQAVENGHTLQFQRHAAAIQKLQRGIAMAAALQTPQIAPGHRRAVKFGIAYYDDQTGLAGGYAERLNQNVSVNAEMATSHQFKEVILRGGVNYSW